MILNNSNLIIYPYYTSLPPCRVVLHVLNIFYPCISFPGYRCNLVSLPAVSCVQVRISTRSHCCHCNEQCGPAGSRFRTRGLCSSRLYNEMSNIGPCETDGWCRYFRWVTVSCSSSQYSLLTAATAHSSPSTDPTWTHKPNKHEPFQSPAEHVSALASFVL